MSVLDEVQLAGRRADNIKNTLSKCSPKAYYFLKGFSEIRP